LEKYRYIDFLTSGKIVEGQLALQEGIGGREQLSNRIEYNIICGENNCGNYELLAPDPSSLYIVTQVRKYNA
jgi:hypothetical protein